MVHTRKAQQSPGDGVPRRRDWNHGRLLHENRNKRCPAAGWIVTDWEMGLKPGN